MKAARICRVVVVMVVVGATLGVTALAGASLWQLAKQLVAKDPGARVGGNTIVVTGKGERVLGVPDRPNFIVALGTGETISAGSRNSELGALGEHDTIVGGRGHELIVGGPDGTVIANGAHELVVDWHPNATIRLEGSDDEVIVSGHNDHVVCSGPAFGEQIHDTRSDTVSKSCRNDHNHVKHDAPTFVRAARTARAPTAHAADVRGDGSNDDPYTAPCDSPPSHGSCTVSFPARTLSGLWANESVPAYTCPRGRTGGLLFPYLDTHDYAPAGTHLPRGVEVQGLGPIGVSIEAKWTLEFTPNSFSLAGYPTGTLRDGSSATNWTLGTAAYRVILHCLNYPPY